MKIDVAEGATSQNIIAFDTITVTAVKPGMDSYTVILTNESHTLPTTNLGVVTYTGSGTSIIVYKGATELNSISGTPGAGEFSVSAIGTNIKASTPTIASNPTVYPDHSEMTQDNASITYTINVENTTTFTKIQSFSKSKEGPRGYTGAEGKKAVSGIVYYQSVSQNAPATPTATSYNLSTNSFSGLTSNWSLTSPTFQSSNGAKYWYYRFYGTESTTANIVSVETFTSPYTAINFSGLVTFTSAEGTLSQANSNVTSIDGGLLTTAIINSSAEISSGKPKMTINMNSQKLSIGQSTQGYGTQGIFLGYDGTHPKFSISGSGGISSATNYIA